MDLDNNHIPVAVPSEIAQNMRVSEDDLSTRYDASARNLVAQKPVLAYILKSALDEYADVSVPEIAEKYIEGKPEVQTMAVHQDHPDKAGVATYQDFTDNPDESDSKLMSGDDKIEGTPTDDKSQREGTIYYDIRFTAIVPQSGEPIEIYVNCEIQNNDQPGYPIPKRGIYYAARMISAQRGKVFRDQAYGKLKKVVSIWICEDTSDVRSDTINRYALTEQCLRGNFHEKMPNYDLMTVVVLRLGSKGVNSDDDAIRLLSKLFSDELGYEKKLDSLEHEFRISVTKELSGEVLNVCNLSTGIYNKGYGSGYGSGKSDGKTEQAQETAYRLRRKGMSIQEIADMVNVSVDKVTQWLAEPQVT